MSATNTLSSLDITLTTLKFAGIVISSLASIVAAMPEHKRGPKNQGASDSRLWRRLTTKQAALNFAIGGFAVALLSQAVETVKDKSDSSAQATKDSADLARYAEAEKELQQESHKQSETLEAIQKLITRFDKFSYVGEFQLPPQDPRVAKLAGELHTLACTGFTSGPSPHGVTVISKGTSFANVMFAIPEVKWDEHDLVTALPSLPALAAVWNALPLESFRVWINRKARPAREFLTASNDADDLSFYNIDAENLKRSELVYRDDDGSISIRTPAFSCESSSDFCWKDNNTIVGVDDLSAAQFVTEFFWSGAKANQTAADPLLLKLIPVRIDITVGHNVVVFYGRQSQVWPRHAAENLTARPAFYVAATFPPAADILTNKTARDRTSASRKPDSAQEPRPGCAAPPAPASDR
jgi:hypothetical protein